MGSRVKKTRGGGRYTEAGYFGFIRSGLREKSRRWPPIHQARQLAKRKHTGSNKRQKFDYQCNICKDWFKGTEVQVDHITPAGSLKCYDDLPQFVSNLFCEQDNLQVVCSPCHDVKTKRERKK